MRTLKNIPSIFKKLLNEPESDSLKELAVDELLAFLRLTIEELDGTETVQYLGENFKDTVIVGDIHGEIETISKLTSNFMSEKIQSIIFLNPIETITLQHTCRSLPENVNEQGAKCVPT